MGDRIYESTMKLLVQSAFYGKRFWSSGKVLLGCSTGILSFDAVAVLASVAGQPAAYPQLRHQHQVDPTLAQSLDLIPGQNVSSSTFNKMQKDYQIGQVVVPCLMPNNTNDKYCAANVYSSLHSNLYYFPDIVLIPSAKYANPKEQVHTGLKSVEPVNVGYIWVDVSYPAYWAGPVSVNQQFLKEFLEELQQVSGFSWDHLGIRTFEEAWTDITGSWNYPSTQGMQLWHVLLDGDPSLAWAGFGGWTEIHLKQYLIRKSLCSVAVNYDFLRPNSSPSRSSKRKLRYQ